MNECNRFQIPGLKDDESNERNGTRLRREKIKTISLTIHLPVPTHRFSQNTEAHTHITFFNPSPIMLLCLAGLCAVLLRTWPPTVL